jgi:homoserine O-acetyltransferase/O-succinyltransferase
MIMKSTIGDVRLQRGATLRDCKLAYKTFGKLNAAKDNAIVYPTWYSGQHYDNEWLVGSGMALDPDKFFIIIPNMLGNGLSSSPSNTPEPYNGPRFPRVTACDNVRVQHRLVTEKFGIRWLPLVTGWSMGALQTFHWGALYPDMVERIAPFCGSAKCSRHNFVFLEGVKAALTADAAFAEGWYEEKPARGLRAMARVYAGWGFSQAFYRERLDLERLGYSSLEDFLVAFWEGFFLPKDANNLLAMLWTWQNGDISDNEIYNGDFKKALGAQGQSLCDARPDRPLLSARRQPIRSRQHAEREILTGPFNLGPFRWRSRNQSGRRQIPRQCAERASAGVIEK